MFLLLQIGIYQFLPQVKKKIQFLPWLQLIRGVLIELAGRLKEYPVGLDDQLVEGCAVLKNETETRLYVLSGSRLP